MALVDDSILISPDNGEQLHWDSVQAHWRTADGQWSYPLENGVLQLLPNRKNDIGKTKEEFDYREHYQMDAEVFNYSAGWEDPAATHENRRLHECILAQCPAHTKRVLDVGCGAAWVAKALLPMGKEVYSMDISTVNPAKAVAAYSSEQHIGVVGDVFHLPFAAGSFDCIVASEIIEHLTDPALFLRKLLPALAPGGRLIVTTPNEEKLAYSLCIHCNQTTPHNAHLHSFSASGIRALLPPAYQMGARTSTFMNKLLLLTRTYKVLQYFPYRLWRMLDSLTNVLFRKPGRLMLVVERPLTALK